MNAVVRTLAPSACPSRALSIRMALTEALRQWRRDLDAAEYQLRCAVEFDADAIEMEQRTERVLDLRDGVRDLQTELARMGVSA